MQAQLLPARLTDIKLTGNLILCDVTANWGEFVMKYPPLSLNYNSNAKWLLSVSIFISRNMQLKFHAFT